MKRVLFLAFILSLLLPGCVRDIRQPGQPLELVLLHTNDTHSYVAGRDKYGNACVASADCTGGMGRIATVVRDERRAEDNVLVVDAGDQFQGTLFFTVNGWSILADLDNLVGYDAATLGNHEFDRGCEPLAGYIRALHYPILAANLTPATSRWASSDSPIPTLPRLPRPARRHDLSAVPMPSGRPRPNSNGRAWIM